MVFFLSVTKKNYILHINGVSAQIDFALQSGDSSNH